ncbi:permease prefix domain 1-containing protein [Micromonospora fluostatini]|uniref:permease prefix domain 1-containing protein n=1 Tax=Micromonospora sp. JCM 30529 TaxID=3421643 RepID=UPI003D16897F
MRGNDETCVDDRVRELAAQLRGPVRLKADLLTEARHALLDAAEAYREDGLPAAEAGRRAVAEFGTPAQLVPAYQAELSAGALRGLALRVVLFAVPVFLCADLTWRGAPWADATVAPAGYGLLSSALTWLWGTAVGLAVAGLLLATVGVRYGRVGRPAVSRAAGFTLTAVLALGTLSTVALWVWSLDLWQGLLTWPPMIVGVALIGAGQLWLGGAARSWLLATR